MLLIEADGKALFAEYGIAVPDSVMVGEGSAPTVMAPTVMAGGGRPSTPFRDLHSEVVDGRPAPAMTVGA